MNNLKLKPKLDKTIMALTIILCFVLGVTIGQYILFEKQAHAVLLYPNQISIQLSNTCLKLIQANQTDDCPTYNKLLKYDTSNQTFSGQFVNSTFVIKGKATIQFLHRGIPKLPIHFTLYKSVTFVDPDSKAVIFGKLIIIVPHGFTFTDAKDVVINRTSLIHHDWYVTPDCTQATISYSDSILNDTINYLKSGCTTKPIFNGTAQVKISEPKLNYNTAWSKYLSWLKEAKKQHVENCITHKCKTPRDPFANW